MLLAGILAQPACNAHPLGAQQCSMQGGMTFCICAAPVLNGKRHPWEASKLQMLVESNWEQMF